MSGLTSRAEWALERLTSREAEYRSSVSSASRSRGRHIGTSARTEDVNALVDCCAIAESFAVSRFTDMFPQIAADKVRTWEKRTTAWSRHANVELTYFADWSSLRGFVEVRNSVMHGDGRLTDQQLDKYKLQTLSYIGATGVELNGDSPRILSKDVARCIEVCDSFIRWLDANAPSA